MSGNNHNSEIFVRFYINAYRSGLVASLGADLWTTLEAIATFMNEKGYCFPSQETLGEQLGVSRKAVNQRIQRLLDFRWNGQAVIEREYIGGSQHTRCKYRILPTSQLAIFGGTVSSGGYTEYEPVSSEGNTEIDVEVLPFEPVSPRRNTSVTLKGHQCNPDVTPVSSGGYNNNIQLTITKEQDPKKDIKDITLTGDPNSSIVQELEKDITTEEIEEIGKDCEVFEIPEDTPIKTVQSLEDKYREKRTEDAKPADPETAEDVLSLFQNEYSKAYDGGEYAGDHDKDIKLIEEHLMELTPLQRRLTVEFTVGYYANFWSTESQPFPTVEIMCKSPRLVKEVWDMVRKKSAELETFQETYEDHDEHGRQDVNEILAKLRARHRKTA